MWGDMASPWGREPDDLIAHVIEVDIAELALQTSPSGPAIKRDRPTISDSLIFRLMFLKARISVEVERVSSHNQ